MIPVRHYIDTLVMDGKVANKNHYLLFEEAGYIPIILNDKASGAVWHDIHEWALEHIGYSNYNWTGSVFWFMNEKDAMLFALRWA